MTLLLKVACPDCGFHHDSAPLGAGLRCAKCGLDFRALADGEGGSRIISVTPDDMDAVPYSQRSVELPVNSISSVVLADPSLLHDKLLRDVPQKDNARWLGNIRLLKKLGQGGMGTVYRGYDESLLLDVAVKIVPLPAGERDTKFVERFRQEARISAQIIHPHVVRTLHVDEEGGLTYLVMDFVEGQTARELADAKGPLPLPLALQIVLDATSGMQAAHEHCIIHRDIKPDNILVAHDGRVLLSDLGLATAMNNRGPSTGLYVTQRGLLLGTPEYMSPEQWDIGAPIGVSSDIWSMGATLWMLLTHRPPYQGSDLSALARDIKESPLPDIRHLRTDLPDNVISILERCLAKKPQDRFSNADELLIAIQNALDQKQALGLKMDVQSPVDPQLAPVVHSMESIAAKGSTKGRRTADKMSAPPPISKYGLNKREGVSPTPTTNNGLNNSTHLMRSQPIGSRTATWVAVAILSVVATLLWAFMVRAPYSNPLTTLLSVDLGYPTWIKAGEVADLHATLHNSGGRECSVLWITGQKAYTGAHVRVPLEHDADITVTVRDINTGKEIWHRDISVSTELQVQAAEKSIYSIESGTPLKLAGIVRGGAPQANEMRWVDSETPGVSLNNTAIFELPLDTPIGRHTYVLQAKRKEEPDWTNAASDRVIVDVVRRIPPEFSAAMRQGILARENAAVAVKGSTAVALWQEAYDAFKKASEILPGSHADTEKQLCAQSLTNNEKYVALLDETHHLEETAEKLTDADGVSRLTTWSEALRSCSAALALFVRPEARDKVAKLEMKVAETKASLENAERQRVLFETMISQTRQFVKEAKKYLSPAVALPHWEAALSGFQELIKRFPARVSEFALELREVQENRDRIFLIENLGITPGKRTEIVPEVTPPKQPAGNGNATKPPGLLKHK